MPLTGLTPHQKIPVHVSYKRGYTAELASGMHIGRPIQAAWSHMVNYRGQGPCMSFIGDTDHAVNPYDGAFHPIIHYPPAVDGQPLNLALMMHKWSHHDTNGWYVAHDGTNLWEAAAAIAGPTTLAQDYADSRQAVIEVTPPSGVAGNGFSKEVIGIDNVCIASMSGFWLPHLTAIPTVTDIPEPADFSAGRIITEADSNVGGMAQGVGIGDTAMNIAAIERCTRRVFCNVAFSEGIDVGAGQAKTNLFNGATIPAQCRNLDKSGDAVKCYPAFVITCSGQGSGNFVTIYYTSAKTGKEWSWTSYNGFSTSATLVTYDATGVAVGDTDGLDVASDEGDGAIDDITVEVETDAGTTCYINTVALFEGPPTNWG